jgi:copper resistance protein B
VKAAPILAAVAAVLLAVPAAADDDDDDDRAGAAQPVRATAERAILVHGSLDQFETRTDGRAAAFRWSGQGWVGTGDDKLRIKTEGFVRGDGSVDDGQHHFLYSRAVSTYVELQAGLRSDIDSQHARHWAAFGLQGLAPLVFDLEATVYARDGGHFAARIDVSYDLPIADRLILQPEIEVNLYSRSDPARLVGAGISDIDLGLRLRYAVTRNLAPYMGLAYDGKFGRTAALARRAGEGTGEVRLVFGVRSWF